MSSAANSKTSKCMFVSSVGRRTKLETAYPKFRNGCQLFLSNEDKEIPLDSGENFCVLHVEKDETTIGGDWLPQEFEKARIILIKSLEKDPEEDFLDLSGIRFPGGREGALRLFGKDRESISDKFKGILLIDCYLGSIIQIEDIRRPHFDLNARKAQFLRDLEIAECTIDNADFADAKFSGENIKFKNVIFRKKVDFSGSNFESLQTEFEAVVFKEPAVFTKCKLSSGIRFAECTFEKGLDFSDASFFNFISFLDCQFKKPPSNLRDPQEEASESIMLPCLDMSNNRGEEVTPIKKLSFKKCFFEYNVNFTNRIFDGEVSFEGSIINNPINFTRAKMPLLPSFTNAEFKDLTRVLEQEGGVQELQAWRRSFSFLKNIARESGDSVNWFNFGIREKNASLFQSTPYHPNRFAWWLYGLIADYGKSWLLPIFSLFILLIFFFSFNCFFDLPKFGKPDGPSLQSYVGEKIAFTVTQTVRPFNTFDARELVKNPPALIVGAFLQSCLTIILVGILVLAIRNQFLVH